MASGGYTEFIRLWDTSTWEIKKEIKLISDGHISLSYNPKKENMLASGYGSDLIFLWNTNNG